MLKPVKTFARTHWLEILVYSGVPVLVATLVFCSDRCFKAASVTWSAAVAVATRRSNRTNSRQRQLIVKVLSTRLTGDPLNDEEKDLVLEFYADLRDRLVAVCLSNSAASPNGLAAIV